MGDILDMIKMDRENDVCIFFGPRWDSAAISFSGFGGIGIPEFEHRVVDFERMELFNDKHDVLDGKSLIFFLDEGFVFRINDRVEIVKEPPDYFPSLFEIFCEIIFGNPKIGFFEGSFVEHGIDE